MRRAASSDRLQHRAEPGGYAKADPKRAAKGRASVSRVNTSYRRDPGETGPSRLASAQCRVGNGALSRPVGVRLSCVSWRQKIKRM